MLNGKLGGRQGGRTDRTGGRAKIAGALGLALACGAVAFSPVGAPPALAAAVGASAAKDAPDTVIFRNGHTVKGTILEETDTTVRFLLNTHGITTETVYDKSQILSLRRGERTEEKEESGSTPATPPKDTRDRSPSLGSPEAAVEQPVVYVINLTGKMGRDIVASPLRDMVRAAKRANPDYLIFVVDNEWEDMLGDKLAEDAQHAFDQLFLVEDLDPIIGREIESDWEKVPERVVWVKQAMGGAAFIPFLFDRIYFHPEGRMGGIGNLAYQFSQGDELAIDKQISLRLGHARGMAITGGYEPKLIEAMSMIGYELSADLTHGKPVYHERVAQRPGEITLTDNGEGANEDTIEELARGEGNDVLTLDQDIAKKLGVSRGTVSTLDDLLFQLGIGRSAKVIDSDADRIARRWSDGWRDAQKRIPELWGEFQRVQVAGDYRERQQARGTKLRKLNQIEDLLRRYKESLPEYAAMEEQINFQREQIRLQQMADRR